MITDILALFATLTVNDAILLLTEQMSAQDGLKEFGKDGVDTIMDELKQLLYQKVMHGVTPSMLTHQQKWPALQYLMFLKQKHCG